MRKLMFLSVIALSAMMVSCNKPAQTEQKEAATGEASLEMTAIRTAIDLALYGREVESASALIEAADILASTPTIALDAKVEAGEENADETAKVAKEAPTAAQLLAEARELAGEDATLIAMIEKVETKLTAVAEGTRGAIGGPKYDNSTVSAHSYKLYTQQFYGGSFAEVAVIGDGDTDLDLYIYDENDNLITSDTDYTDRCYVSFQPRWTGYFSIKIVNRGNVYNRYSIATN